MEDSIQLNDQQKEAVDLIIKFVSSSADCFILEGSAGTGKTTLVRHLLKKLDVPFYKVASMDINNYELLKYISQKKKPIILSTGMATMAEISNAVKIIENEGNNQIVILHCIAIYPPKVEDINLNNIPMLQKAFKYPIGFSDHTKGTAIPFASVSLGACVIEKHFTLDKELPGWDHAISANPRELKEIVSESKNIYQALGSFTRVVSEEEKSKKIKFRRSVVAGKELKKGDILKLENLEVKRPGTGIAPDELKYVVGRKLNKNLSYDELISWDDLV